MIYFVLPMLLLNSFNFVYSESLNDLTFDVDKGYWVIDATLYDDLSDKKYFIQERINSSRFINGKISINSDSTSLDIFYNTRSSKNRLVIHDNQCDLFSYNKKWDQKLPGVTQPLLNQILLVGPSVLFRLGHETLVWQNGVDTEIRGTTMHSSYAFLSDKQLNITYYYKSTIDLEEGIKRPSRIEFYGVDPSEPLSSKQTYVLDIYSQVQADEELYGLSVTPGIGCPIYLTNQLGSPIVSGSQLHYISVTNVLGPRSSSKREEIIADSAKQLMNVRTVELGATTEAIYDYKFGIMFVKASSGSFCITSPMGLTTPGIAVYNGSTVLQLNSLLKTDLEYRYLGQAFYGYPMDVWESVEYNKTIDSGLYDKVVTTQYFILADGVDVGSGYVPVSMVINAYTQATSGYNLVESTSRYYYDFGLKINEEEYETRFQMSDCNVGTDSRKTLAFHFSCSQNCNFFGKVPYAYTSNIRTAIVETGLVAPSRIENIDVVFDGNDTIAYVTFLDFPNIQDAFRSSYLYLSASTISGGSKVKTADSTACLKSKASMATTFEAVAYCGDSKLCVTIDKIDNIVIDNNNLTNYCKVFYIPLKNLNRYYRELSLDKIQDNLSQRRVSFSLYSQLNGFKLAQYSCTQIIDVTEEESKIEKLFTLYHKSSKLNSNGNDVMVVSDVKNYGDCYKACVKSDDDDCKTFSYCSNSDGIECLVSDLRATSASVIDADESCSIFTKNVLTDYVKVENRKFKNPSTIAIAASLSECATLAQNSDEYISLQYCHGKCAFGGIYTDKSSQFTKECDIYIPKVAEQFSVTGSKILTQTYHIELSLTLDQCAALCWDWDSGDEYCQSFNYCPKGKTSSSCSLSMYSVNNSSAGTVDSNICKNYGYKSKDNSMQYKSETTKVASGTSTGAVFGIIILCMAVGLMVGISAPFISEKVGAIITSSSSPSSSDGESFNWVKHINEEEEQQSVM